MDPAISPDGRWLVFRRDVTPFTGDLYRVALKDHVVADGEPAQVTFSDSSTAPGKPSWLPGSREVVFAAKGALWRIDALTGGSLTRLPFVGQDGVAPVVTRRSDGQQRLVYVRSCSDSNVWRLDVSEPGAAASPPRVAIGSTRRDDAPSLSPDGRRLVFVSNRSGESEFWVADVNGGNALQLTSLASVPGFGRWSPDGSLIAFHSDPQNERTFWWWPPAAASRESSRQIRLVGAFRVFHAMDSGFISAVPTEECRRDHERRNPCDRVGRQVDDRCAQSGAGGPRS
jgi:Tol biopolymer transport system component